MGENPKLSFAKKTKKVGSRIGFRFSKATEF
jgi:hypothetical protein